MKPLAAKVAQSLLMFSILLVGAWMLIIVSLMVGSIVASWHGSNESGDMLYGFTLYPSEATIALLVMLISAIFWASRVFHWRNPS